MTKPKNSYAELVSQAQVMAAGLKANLNEIKKRGIDEDFVAELEKNRSEAIALNDEQERLKAELKQKTETLNGKIDAINTKMSEAKKLVKLTFPQSQWIEFGIADKR